jgi:hypothetical protein
VTDSSGENVRAAQPTLMCRPFFARHVASPHSVVTVRLIDEAGQPTIAARDEILSFFTRRLAGSI